MLHHGLDAHHALRLVGPVAVLRLGVEPHSVKHPVHGLAGVAHRSNQQPQGLGGRFLVVGVGFYSVGFGRGGQGRAGGRGQMGGRFGGGGVGLSDLGIRVWAGRGRRGLMGGRGGVGRAGGVGADAAGAGRARRGGQGRAEGMGADAAGSEADGARRGGQGKAEQGGWGQITLQGQGLGEHDLVGRAGQGGQGQIRRLPGWGRGQEDGWG